MGLTQGKFRLLVFAAGLAGATSVAPAQSSGWIIRHQRPGGFLWSIASDGERRLVAVGTGGRILVSDDGIVWNSRSSGVADWLVGVTCGHGRFIAVGDNGRILTSVTGDAWTAHPVVPTTARLNNVFFGGYGTETYPVRLVAVGEAGTALMSEDLGASWRVGRTGVTGWLRGLTWLNTRSYGYAPFGGGTSGLSTQRVVYEYAFLACGQGGRIVASVDGLGWTEMKSGTGEDLEAVSACPNPGLTAVALGGSGVVRGYAAPWAFFTGDMNLGYRGPTPTLPDYPAWTAGSLGAASDVRLGGSRGTSLTILITAAYCSRAVSAAWSSWVAQSKTQASRKTSSRASTMARSSMSWGRTRRSCSRRSRSIIPSSPTSRRVVPPAAIVAS